MVHSEVILDSLDPGPDIVPKLIRIRIQTKISFDKMFTKFIIVRENFVYQNVETVLLYMSS